MPSELLTKHFEDNLDTRKGRNPLGQYRAPDSGGFGSVLEQMEESDEFLKNFQTPSDIEEYKNYVLSTGFTEALGEAPFKITGENRAIFDTSAKPQVIGDTDLPKEKAFKKLWNTLVSGKGGVSTGNLASRTFNNSMTGSWAKMLGLSGDMDDFSFQDDGVYFDGHRLKLSDTQARIVSDFQNRTSGVDRDTSFFEKAGESFLSIMWDLPLIAATSLLTGGAGGSLMAAERIATQGVGKIVMQAAKYGAQFNIMGLPQYADAVKTGQNYDVYANIFLHNMAMGSGAALSGQAGRFLSNKLFNNVGFTKEIMKQNPAILETIGALPGSFGFGYGSSKVMGSTDEDALATGLAFAAMHFADAGAFKKMMKLQSQKDVKVLATKWDSKGNPTAFSHDYFTQEGDKLFKIDNEKFAKGEISKISDAIDIDSSIKDELYYYNEIPNHIRVTYAEALEKVRVKKHGKTIYDKWVKELPEDYVKENADKIRYFAELTAESTVLGRLSSAFSKTKLPNDKDIQSKMVKLADDYKMSYQSVKTFLITNLKEFTDDPIKFGEKIARFEGDVPRIVEDMDKTIKAVDKIVVNKALAKWGMSELEQPNRKTVIPRKAETFPQYFTRVMDMKYPNAIKSTLDAEGKKQRTTDDWWELDYEKYRTDQVMLQADYDMYQKKAKKGDAKKSEVDKVVKESKTQGKGEISKEKGIEAKKTQESFNTESTDKTQPTKPSKDFNLLKSAVDSFTSKDETKIDESSRAIVKEAERLRDVANKDVKGKRAQVSAKEMAVLLMKDSGLTEPEIKTILDKAFKENVDVNNIKRKFNVNSEKYLELMNKGVTKDIDEYVRALKEDVISNKENLTEKESTDKYIEDKDLANYVDEITEERVVSTKKKQGAENIEEEELSLHKEEPDRKEHIKKSPEQERIDGLKQSMIDGDLDPTNRADILLAKDRELITDNEAASLFSLLRKGKPKQFVSASGKEKYPIEYVAEHMGEGTLEQAIDKTVEEGNITAKEAEKLKKQYPESALKALYNTSNLSELKPDTPEEREAFAKTTKELFNFDVNLVEEVDQTGVSEGQVRTAVTYTKDGKVTIDVGKLAGIKAFDEEVSHGIMLAATDQPEVIGALKDIAKWNGEKSDWARAHEDLYRQMAAAKAGYMPTNRFFEKIFDWADSVARWFGFNGYKGVENFFRRYSRGLIKVDKGGENQQAKYLKEMLNSDRMVDAERHFAEAEALYNTVNLKDFDERNIPKRLDNFLALTGLKRKLHFNKILEFGREMRPPVIEAETSARFKPIHKTGEEQIIREISGIRNEVAREFWKDGGYLKDMTPEDIDGFNEIKRKYSEEVRDGITDELPPSEFYKRYNLNDKQIAMVDAYQKYAKKFNQLAQNFWSDYLFEQTTNVTKGVSKRKLAEIVPDLVKERNGKKYINLGEVNEYLNKPENADLKRQLAEYIAKRMYSDRDKIYFNDVRPADPRYIMIRMEKASDNPNHTLVRNEAGEITGYKDYVDTYAYNEKHAKLIIEDWEQKGFKTTEQYQIKDLIQGQQWEKLTHHQLMNLIEAGHIQASFIDENGKVKHNPIIDKLMNAVKTGTFKQHSIEKKYIRGMHNTEKELERNLYRFGDEVLGIKRQTAIVNMQKQLVNWRTEIDPILKSPDVSQDVKDKELRAYQYAQKYVNNLSHSDRNFIDGYKGYVGAWYTSMKPSFFVQQLMQGLQTTLHLSRGDSKNGGSYFAKGTQDAWKLMMYLRAKANGQSTDAFGISDEAADIYQWLADRKKLGKVGLAELTEAKTDLEYKYLTGSAKTMEAFKRAMNVPSAAIEKFTRMQSMMTFYRIGKERNLSGDGLKQFIADKIDLSMSEWGVGGRSPLFASGVPGKGQASIVKALDKGFMTFKTFGTHNLALYEYLMRNKMWGALGSKLMAGAAFHGITKFPLMATMFAIANIFTEDDMEYETLRLLEDVNDYVPNLGTVLARGGGGLVGISMENLFNETSLLPTDTWDNLRAKSWQGKLAEAMLGAPYGLGRDVWDSAEAHYKGLMSSIRSDRYMSEDDKEKTLKNMYKLYPLTVRNIVNTFMFDRDGVELRGKTIIKKEDLDWRDVVLKVMSFNPLKYAKAYEEQFQGFPAKWSRINGKITELKKIRKENKTDNVGLARELQKTIEERSKMMRTKDYIDAKSKGLI